MTLPTNRALRPDRSPSAQVMRAKCVNVVTLRCDDTTSSLRKSNRRCVRLSALVMLAALLIGLCTPRGGLEAKEPPAGEEGTNPSEDASSETTLDDAELRRLLSVVRGSNRELPERVSAAKRALAGGAKRVGRAALYAGRALLPASPAHGVPLIRAGLSKLAQDERAELRETVLAFAARHTSANRHGDAKQDLGPVWALAMDLGALDDGVVTGLLATWPASKETLAAIEHTFALQDAAASKGELLKQLQERLPVLRTLEQANADDPKVAGPALDALVSMGKNALPLLHDVALQAAGATPERTHERALRAVLVLGFIGDPSSISVLGTCLASKTNGWLRARAAVALGDTGLPAAAPALAWHLCVLSDLFRSRDQWDYPGPKETTLTAEEWPSAHYFSVDAHAADALLRLGIPGAAGYLIEEKLNPDKANFRVRVLQDAIDALRRNVKGLDTTIYNVDQGTPQRTKAYRALRAWWRSTGPASVKLHASFDENDPQFADVSDQLSARLLRKDAREFIITKAACELLGTVMTPSLLRTLAKTDKLRARCELAVALGRVGDPRAIDPLLQLARDKRETVRAKALEALSAYVAKHERVQARLLEALKEAGEAGRVAAMKALVMAPRSASIKASIQAANGDDPDFQRAKDVTLFIQGDDSRWQAIDVGLKHKQRVVRRSWWELLKRGLAIPATVFNATAVPGSIPDNQVTLDVLKEYRDGSTDEGTK